MVLPYFKCISRILLLIMLISCEDFIQVDAPNTLQSSETVFASDASANSAIAGIYTSIMDNQSFASGGDSSITVLAGLSADEFIDYTNSAKRDFQTNNLSSGSSLVKNSLWTQGYRCIYYANVILEGIANSKGMSEALKRRLKGEAQFLRAFSYFYLTNMFGDIPLIVHTDYEINKKAAKVLPEDIYNQIISDLSDATELLPESYAYYMDQQSQEERRVRPNAYAAYALLARVYLYTHDWLMAEASATVVINNTALYGLQDDLSQVFIAQSREAIWQLMPIDSKEDTYEEVVFTLNDIPTSISLTDQMVNAFETDDNRKKYWVDTIIREQKTYFYPSKYKVGEKEYSIVLRLAEQYLIRSEARAQQDKQTQAIADINILRQRADVPPIDESDPNIDKTVILLAIEHERQTELFSEWGHRWFDLKRTGRATSVLSPQKGSNWQSTDVLYPIPASEIQKNGNLEPQNEGY